MHYNFDYETVTSGKKYYYVLTSYLYKVDTVL